MTLESLLSERPMTAYELSRLTGKRLEEVYERLVHLEACGIAELRIVFRGKIVVEKLWRIA